MYASAVLSASPILSLKINPFDEQMCIGFADGMLRMYEAEDEAYRFREIALVDAQKYLKKRQDQVGEELENIRNCWIMMNSWYRNKN